MPLDAAQTDTDTAAALALGRGLTVASIRTAAGVGLGLRTARGVLDVAAAAAVQGWAPPLTTDDFVNGRGDIDALKTMASAVESGADWTSPFLIPEGEVGFAPVVADPGKVICVGLNYRAHADEANLGAPTDPILFNKFRSSMNNHRGTIAVSREPAEKFDYEAELVIVIGRAARAVSEAEALDYAFGYACGQDFSARDLQKASSQWMLGKCGDGWGPAGPWLVGADLVDPDKLDIQCLVNGEMRQSSNTADMIFSCSQIIAYASRFMTLLPGDVIFSGTPEGVILGYPPEKQVWLKAGDRIVTRIETLGELEVSLT